MKTYKRTVHMMVPHENGQWVKLSEAQSTIAELTSRLAVHERAAQATIKEMDERLANIQDTDLTAKALAEQEQTIIELERQLDDLACKLDYETKTHKFARLDVERKISEAVAAETERCAVVCDKRTGTSERARARV